METKSFTQDLKYRGVPKDYSKQRTKLVKAVSKKSLPELITNFFASHRVATAFIIITLLLSWIIILALQMPEEAQIPVNAHHLIRTITQQGLYKAKPNEEFKDMTLKEATQYLGGSTFSSNMEKIEECADNSFTLPDEFDARQKWPGCFFEAFKHGKCSTSWAAATATMLSNRLCIAAPENLSNIRLSPQSFLSCDKNNKGCTLGANDAALYFSKYSGLHSTSCFPYSASERPCEEKCKDEKPFQTSEICSIKKRQKIKAEIYQSGPVLSVMMLYNDLLLYGGDGVYTPTALSKRLVKSGTSASILHSITIVGWGEDKTLKLPYWIIQNNFGPSWGDYGGFAKIAMDQPVVFEELTLAGSYDIVKPIPIEKVNLESK